MKRIFTKIIGLLCFFMLFLANVQAQQDTVYVYQKDASLYKMNVSQIDSIRYTTPSGDNTFNIYDQGSIVYSKAVKDIDSITFYYTETPPVVPVPTFMLSFNGNGHTSGTVPVSQTADSGAIVKAPAHGDLAKTGYDFVAWNTAMNGTGTTYAAASNITLKSALTLYAQWKAVTLPPITVPIYTISFNGNGHTKGTVPVSQTADSGTVVVAPAHGDLAKTGYDFTGWNTQSNGSGTAYAVAANITLKSALTLYAQWKAVTLPPITVPIYTISFNGNGHTKGTVPVSQTADSGTVVVAPAHGDLAKTGYDFTGWNTQSNGSGTAYAVAANITLKSALTLYAQWEIKTYTISFNGNGHTNGTVPVSQTADSGTVVVAPAHGDLAKTGYDFTGWNTQSDGSGTAYAVAANITLKSVLTLYAQWKIKTYTISFNGNGHTKGKVPASQTADSGTVVVAPKHGDLDKTGYDFTGWNTQSDGSGEGFAVASNITLKSALTLYAQWEIDPDFIAVDTTFIVNGVSFNMIYVQGGTFTMGCTEEQGNDCDSDENPSHQVTLSDYYIGEFELTQGLWKAVMGSNPMSYEGDKFPVESVNWGVCQSFISELNRLTGKTFSLPTEAQWEYAARGGNKSQGYKYAGSNTIADVAWYPESKRYEVGTKSANELGIYDMSGNVREWCNDWYDNYTAEAQTNPKGPSSGSKRVHRGSSQYSDDIYFRVSDRDELGPIFHSEYMGFRLVLDPRLRVLSFNGNGHNRGTAPASIIVDSSTVVVAPTQGNLAKTGYDFIGWNTQSDGNGESYAVAANITLKSALTLYAQWTENTSSNTTTITVNGHSFEMISVQGGSFAMGCTNEQGSDCFDDEKPSHTVTLSDYYIGEFEVTQGLWKAVMGVDNNPSNFKGDHLPVEQVSWDDCQGFISELNRLTAKIFALPTEAQWEYAARGGSKSSGAKYSGSHSIEDVAWYNQNSDRKTHEGGPKWANELGIYDMSGNVYEWCSDWYDNYTAELQTNPEGPSSGSYRVFRGGAWDSDERLCRVLGRNTGGLGYRGSNIGFRLVLDPRFRVLSFNGNGHTIGTVPASVIVDSGTVVVVPTQGNLAKKGYDFTGWNTQSDGNGESYVVAANIPLKSALTLYAQWDIDPDFIAVDTTFIVNGVSFNMIYVQGGTFTMGCTEEQGSDCESEERPSHQVTLSDYYIGEFELTQELWKAVMAAGNPSSFKGDKLPVEYVSWNDCQGFISELNRLTGKTFVLPTEAQWEYAARGGSKSQAYKYSGGNSIADVAWHSGNSAKTQEVGTKSANELGIYDMSGNVFEWCSDWYDNYTAEAQTNPKGPSSGSYRVLRGGNWRNDASYCRVLGRNYTAPSAFGSFLGFRLVLDPRLRVLSFNGNGHTIGTVPVSVTVDSGTIVVVPTQGNLAKKGYDFTGWNTQSDGSGTAYAVAANIPLKSALTLYAQWEIDPDFIAVDTTFIVNGVSFNMIYVQGGTFTMGCTEEQGSDCYASERPIHQVTLSDYYIGELELTQGLWKAVMGAANNPSSFKGDKLPVEQVSLDDCQGFISELNRLTGKTFSLPTEAQWEYAARGGSKSQAYKYAGGNSIADVAWHSGNSAKTQEVGTKSANELGIYDMSGNVFEWCSDWYDNYTAEAQTNPKGPSSGSNRVFRGGNWRNDASYCRVSDRSAGVSDLRFSFLGFRLVLVQ